MLHLISDVQRMWDDVNQEKLNTPTQTKPFVTDFPHVLIEYSCWKLENDLLIPNLTPIRKVKSSSSNSDMKECLLAFPRVSLDVIADYCNKIVRYVPIVTTFFLVLFLCTFINFLRWNAIIMKYIIPFKPNWARG